MALVLSHISALEYWLSVRSPLRSYVEVTHAKALIGHVPGIESPESLGPWWLSRPLNVIVARDALRRNSTEYKCHTWKAALPKGTVFDTQNGFCVCSPELCFLQMASVLPLVELIELGFELCGIYDLASSDVVRCAPLTTVARISSCIEKVQNVQGRKKAMRALRFVLEKSASPMETRLAMLLCLPYKLGGYGLEAPLLNHEIPVTKQAKKFTANDFFEVDMFWPDYRLIGEYDSDLWHSGARKETKDTARRNALEAMGYTVVSVTLDQVKSKKATDKLANALAEHTGHRFRFNEADFESARTRLRTELFSGRRYGLPVGKRS